MSELGRIFRKLVSEADESIDDLMLRLRTRLGLTDPLQIVPYRTYGNPGQIFIKGRVLEDKVLTDPSAYDTVFENLVNMYKRFESDEVAGAQLRVTAGGKTYEIQTDDEGYFSHTIIFEPPLLYDRMWYPAEINLISAPVPFQAELQARAEILIPAADAEYGIISDIDDTILQTGATNLILTARNTFFHNSHTRLPFAGVAEFYRALQLGRNGKRNNPFFYVSSSPWNVYDLLTDFLDLNKIPAGPLLLRDYGFSENKLFSRGGHMNHKFKEIEKILLTYPALKFVLIGDSGQEDPKIYREVVKKFPERILAVYIRDVQIAEKGKIVMDISEELQSHKIDMLLVDTTVEAAEHAAENGLIFSEAIPPVVEEKKLDRGEIQGKKTLDIVQ